jgi:DNA-binding CsgD family transcriptional regulator
MQRDAINQALDRCYDAAFCSDDWSQSLQDLSLAANAAGAMFIPQIPDRSILDLPASCDYHDFLKVYVQNRWYENNHRVKVWDIIRRRRNVAIVEDDLSTPEERKKLVSYNEYYLRNGFYGFAAAGFIVEGKVWAVSFQRYRSQGHFDRRDARVVASLIPHFRRMISFHDRLSRRETSAGLHSLERVGLAAIAIDRSGRIVSENTGFVELLGPDLSVVGGRLIVRHRGSAAELGSLIASVAGARGAMKSQDRDIALIRRQEGRPIVVEGYAVPVRYPDLVRSAVAILIFRDLEAISTAPEDQLKQAFALTAAEARVVRLLAEGDTPESIAEASSTSLSTVRTQIKSAYAKLDVSRQAELVQLVARFRRS